MNKIEVKPLANGTKIRSGIHNRFPFLAIAGVAIMLGIFPGAAADYNITNFGARADNPALATTAIQNTINAACNAGGGRVIVPAGRFRSGSLTLKNNVTLRLDTRDSILAGSADYRDYGDAFINAAGGAAKRIEGPGIIDGVNCFNPHGEEGFRGPHCIAFGGCDGFSVVGVTITNSANYALIGWGKGTLNILVQNVKIRGGHDGLHLQGANNITVQNCDFQTGDDAFAGCDNQAMSVTDCQINSSCNGMRFGAKDLTVKHCRFWGPGQFEHRVSHRTNMQSAFTYFSPQDRNPVIPGNNIILEDCRVENVDTLFSYHYGSQWQEGQVLKNVTLRNITASGLLYGVAATGDAGRQFDLTMENVEVSFRPGSEDRNCVNLSNVGTGNLKGVTLRHTGN
jgi:Pectate lyase superfamily protein